MHVTVTDGCISCGLCADEFPELFHLNDEAANDCPVGVIVISE